MIISKAIEILTIATPNSRSATNADYYDANKLGIEALKRIQNCRIHPWLSFHIPLDGESMPERGIR